MAPVPAGQIVGAAHQRTASLLLLENSRDGPEADLDVDIVRSVLLL